MMDLIKEFKGLPPWGRASVAGVAVVAAVIYISKTKQSSTSLYEIAPTPEELPEPQNDYVQGQLQDLAGYVDSNSLALNDVINAEVSQLNDIFRNTTESIMSELNDVKGQLVARTNAGDMSQETGGIPGMNQNLFYTADDANYGKSNGSSSSRLSASEQLKRTAEIISDMVSKELDTTIQTNWLNHVAKTGEDYDKVPVASSGSSKKSKSKASASVTVKVGADGKAPSGLKAGDSVKTGGGTYKITGTKPGGGYTSVKVS